MPYIKQEDRDRIKFGARPSSPGELNYVITNIINTYLDGGHINYSLLNSVIGVLESAKLELYRRVVSPYEDKKCQLNGDVYE